MAHYLDDSLRNQVLDLSRQAQIGPLSPFLSQVLDQAIAAGHYPDAANLARINDVIIAHTARYREASGRDTVVLGMSGGVDSALTAAVFKHAGWRVVGVTMPIHQDPAETRRGEEACQALAIAHLHIDLSSLYDASLATLTSLDPPLAVEPAEQATRIRRGNVRARLRMITLYNLAASHGGIVASTDNLSELEAGFWTLHGDVGDVSPIQSLTKSWEIPYLARINGVPEATVRAKPTDGLGIDAGDEAQLGCSYLEWDLMVFALSRGLEIPVSEERVRQVVTQRMRATWYKRQNPIKLPHPLEDRYWMLEALDRAQFKPEGIDAIVERKSG